MLRIGASRARRATMAGLLLCALIAVQTSFAAGSRELVTLNFVDADVEAVARTVGLLVERQVVVDPRVKGKVSLSTDTPISPAAALDRFTAAMRLLGYAVVDREHTLWLVPEADAKLLTGTVVRQEAAGGDQVVTQIFWLNHESAAALVPVLRPLISPSNVINVGPAPNTLVITDYAANLRRLGRIISALDVANSGELALVPLRNATASDVAPLVQRLVESASPTGATAASEPSRTVVFADSRTNSLVVKSRSPASLAQIQEFVARLDAVRPDEGAGGIYVVSLKNAEASRLAVTLRAALAAASGGAAQAGIAAAVPAPPGAAGGTARPGTAPGSSPASLSPASQPSTGGQIQADPATNSLVITASPPQFRQLMAVIERLDGRRAQVFVECLIAEVNTDSTADFGIQWQGLNEVGNLVSYLGTNFGTGSDNIITLNTTSESGSVSVGRGANFALAYKAGGVYVLGFLARALQENGQGNVLSTPTLVTLDNEEAQMVVGQNVPFVTGQYSSTGAGSSGTVNPFQTVERKDVGLTLRIKPQISESGTIVLKLYQEVSSVQGSTGSSPNGPTTNKRSIESTVLVEDKGIVVLGGLLQDEYSDSVQKVPLVSDVPMLGNLFRSTSRARKKTNLMVFIRPVILRDAATTERLSWDRYEQMKGLQTQARPVSSKLLPVDGGPLLESPGETGGRRR